jgi:hypothetical protein
MAASWQSAALRRKVEPGSSESILDELRNPEGVRHG